MIHAEIAIVLLISVVGFTLLARRIGVAYPIVLVAGGIALGFVPGLPRIDLRPDVVFLLFLPPILYWEALTSSPRELLSRSISIGLLATVLVLATIAAVACALHLLVPALPWPMAIAVGAVVAPTDALAVSAISEKLPFPRTLLAILEGESLFNDASALVVFGIATGIAASGVAPTVAGVAGEAVWTSVGGVLAGLATGWLAITARKRMTDPVLQNVLSLATAFAAYFVADVVHASGILGVVTCGFFVGRVGSRSTQPEYRLQSESFFQVISFALNGMLFVLVGLQLVPILRTLGAVPSERVLLLIGVVWLVITVVRALFVFPSSRLARGIADVLRSRTGSTSPPWRSVAIVGWCGIRGGISVATALSLPLHVGGVPSTERSTLVAVAYGTVIATLLVQGLTLPPFVRRMLGDGLDEPYAEELSRARVSLAEAGLDELDRRASESGVPHERVDAYRGLLEAQIRRSPTHSSSERVEKEERRLERFDALRQAVLDRQRDALMNLRESGNISDVEYRDLLRALDRESVRQPLL